VNAAKLDALAKHLQDGGSLDKKAVSDIVGCTPKAVKTMEKYLEGVAEQDEKLKGITLGGENPYADSEEEEDGGGSAPEDASESPVSVETATDDPPKPPKSDGKKTSKKPYRFFLKGENGTAVELQKVPEKSKGKVVYFEEKPVSEVVKIMIKGEVAEVDIVPLRLKRPADQSPYGISNELLLNLALAAR